MERILKEVQRGAVLRQDLEERVVAGRAHNEDAALVSIHSGMTLVQTVDILAPIVNDGYDFGRIAAANALSDVYAMGGKPWCAMNMLFFPSACHAHKGEECMVNILRGGLDILNEADAVLVGGHTVEDAEIKYGLSVTGVIDAAHKATNDGLRVGDRLLLTKPLGTGILATAVKARWDNYEESEQLIAKWCAKLNKNASLLIKELKLTAATDITGFGLGGHSIEMARASKLQVVLESSNVPAMTYVLDYAKNGLIPATSHANRKYWLKFTHIPTAIDASIESLIFDTQTSGGLLLAVPQEQVQAAVQLLQTLGETAWVVGHVRAKKQESDAPLMII